MVTIHCHSVGGAQYLLVIYLFNSHNHSYERYFYYSHSINEQKLKFREAK